MCGNNLNNDKEIDRYQHSKETILRILHSIVDIDNEKGFDVMFEGEQNTESIHSFMPESFTHKLLNLIAEHLK